MQIDELSWRGFDKDNIWQADGLIEWVFHLNLIFGIPALELTGNNFYHFYLQNEEEIQLKNAFFNFCFRNCSGVFLGLCLE